MKNILFLGIFLCWGVKIAVAQTLNLNEIDKLKQFLVLESAEAGKKNYQQLGIQSLETMDLSKVNGLVWNVNGRLDSLTWSNKKLGGDLDLSGFTELRYIQCTDNRYPVAGLYIDGLHSIDVTDCISLVYFDCYNNGFTSLDVSTNINLEWICCRWQNAPLKEIDLTHNPKLYHFCGSGNQFEYMDISNNPELRDFFCRTNRLKKIDVSNNLKLKEVYLYQNQLEELDFSNHPELEFLSCYDNQLETLDVSGCPKLKTLTAQNNQLKELKIDYLDMDVLRCQNNYLSFSTLPRLKSWVDFTYAAQKTIKLTFPANTVDLRSEYRIGGNISEFFWTNNPKESNEGMFTFDNTLKNLTCYVTNSLYPGIMLTYDIELLSSQSVDMLRDIEVYAIENMLYLKTNRPLTAEIYRVTGDLAYQLTIVEGENMVPLVKGIYIVKLSNGLVRKVLIR